MKKTKHNKFSRALEWWESLGMLGRCNVVHAYAQATGHEITGSISDDLLIKMYDHFLCPIPDIHKVWLN